ncbi:O-methyltransferase [Micromonosporaceae bacterium Da 78-11]
MQTPPQVTAAVDRSGAAGFTLSSERTTGELLTVLAGAVRPGGRILEIGTGSGVGLGRLVAGLGTRTDVAVHSVELDPEIQALAAAGRWPDFVRLHLGDVLDLYDTLGTFDLIFADAPGGKWHGLDRTIAALTPGGLLLVDDMTPPAWGSAEHQDHTHRVRDTLLGHGGLNAVEIAWSGGLILCSRSADLSPARPLPRS